MGVWWKESICLAWRVVDFCQTQAIGQGQGLSVYAFSPDNIDVFICLTMAEGILQGGIYFASRTGGQGVAEDDVATVRKGPFGQGLVGLPSHNDRMSGGEKSKSLEIIGKMIEEPVVIADGTVTGYGGDDGDSHVGILSLGK